MDLVKAEAAFKELLELCQQLSKHHEGDEPLKKACTLMKKALAGIQSVRSPDVVIKELDEDGQEDSGKGGEEKEEKEDDVLKDSFRWFSQACLDTTYHQETNLVQGSFMPDVSLVTISAIIYLLSMPAILCGSVEKANSFLDPEILECLHWRVGALMYMYCHTVMGDKRRKRETKTPEFLECCCVGVGHLQLMLTARSPLSDDEDFTTNDPSVPELMKRGIFSNVHMLALAYAGELCYWSWELTAATDAASGDTKSQDAPESKPPPEHSKPPSRMKMPEQLARSVLFGNRPSPPDSFYLLMKELRGQEYVDKWRSEFRGVDLAQGFLTKYLDTARGALKGKGWSYDRAVQLLVKLKKATK